jgi:hypothetical protein
MTNSIYSAIALSALSTPESRSRLRATTAALTRYCRRLAAAMSGPGRRSTSPARSTGQMQEILCRRKGQLRARALHLLLPRNLTKGEQKTFDKHFRSEEAKVPVDSGLSFSTKRFRWAPGRSSSRITSSASEAMTTTEIASLPCAPRAPRRRRRLRRSPSRKRPRDHPRHREKRIAEGAGAERAGVNRAVGCRERSAIQQDAMLGAISTVIISGSVGPAPQAACR